MGNSKTISVILLVCCLAVAATAHIAEFDEYWQKRALEAEKATNESYYPNPEQMTIHFNKHVQQALLGTNGTRRSLRHYSGPCLATNPIDRCWRCRSNWATDRKRLADCALGFGRNAVGGKMGKFYVVNDPSDDNLQYPKPGTLRHAVTRNESLWIIFDRSMVIRLRQELIMTSHKTIDGRGADVHIAYGAGITVQFIQNVIIHGLHIHDIVPKEGGLIADSENHIGLRTKSDGDGISLFGASNIWIDHISMSNCFDGLVDVIMASTAVTISNCHFTHHNEVMLFGASGGYAPDAKMQVTVAFNHFGRGLIQRMPRCRWGFVHVVNNDYTHWVMYAIGGSEHPTIISHGNRFIAPPNIAAKEVTKRDYAMPDEWKNWQWRSEGDLMMNGAFFVQSGKPQVDTFSRMDLIKAKSGTYVTRLTRFSGALYCYPNKPC